MRRIVQYQRIRQLAVVPPRSSKSRLGGKLGGRSGTPHIPVSMVMPVVDELNEIVRLDGAELVLRAETLTCVSLELDLSRSECPECVVPKALMMQLLRSKLAFAAPDITTVELFDPREPD